MSLHRNRLTQKYHEEFRRLNPEQQKAVDAIEGPVMVIAGPGTGKTQILAARIGKILLSTDTEPSNILCLTYTDAGVVAMRKRLLEFIGPDAYKVNIYTFHAFCNDVIQENISLFEKNSMDPISELEKIQFTRQLIDRFPKNHPLKRYRGDVYMEIGNLQNLFNTMKKEGWTSSFISGKIDEYIEDLPNREGFYYKKSKQFQEGYLKLDKIAEEKEKMEKLRAAVLEFDNFQELMRANDRYDFDDMINWVIKAFEENKNLLAKYQEQFLYILVDEYQDTSGTQNRIVQLLIDFWERPNIFVVGDDDQSIYRFQGANVVNMLHFANSYQKDLLTVVLTNNYRSTQPILDVSQSLIERNKERLIVQMKGLRKDLLAANPKYIDQDLSPSLMEYETQRDEMIGITSAVKNLLEDGTSPSEIAVIYRENKFGEELMEYFRVQRIPAFSRRNLNALDIPLAQKILLVFKYLNCEHEIPFSGDELLFEFLHFDWFNIPPIEIAKLSVEVAERQFSENKTSLRQLLYEKANRPVKDLFSQGLHEGLKHASFVLEKLIAKVPNITLQSLFESIVREGGALTGIMKSEEKVWLIQVLTGLFEFIKDETARNPTLTLKEFVSLIGLMQKENIQIPLIRVSGTDRGVSLLTAHGAKGLEFEHVFFAGCNSSYWEKKRKPYSGFRMPDNVFPTLNSGQGETEELRRLFYVALTRTKQYLTISYSRYKNDGRELEPSMYIAEIQENSELQAAPVYITDEEEASYQLTRFNETIPEIEKLEEDFISRLLDKFVMNATALNNYLNCPLEFYFRNLIRIPSPKNEAIEFGSAVHHALNELFKNMQLNNRQFETKEKFISFFEWYMHRHREHFTTEQFSRRMEYGHDILSAYYDYYTDNCNKIVVTERNIRNVIINGVPLKGKMDKLEFVGKKVNVVDYKTGDPDKAFKKLKRPDDKQPLGGDYWRQAVFYKLLVENAERGWQVVSTEFDFIEIDKKKNYFKPRIDITQEDTEIVSAQLTDVWHKIQNREFYTGCGKDDCHWCKFVKTNKLAIALHELQEEDEV